MSAAVERFHVDHAHLIELQPVQAAIDFYGPEYYRKLSAAGPAYTIQMEGEIVFCGGLVDCEHGGHLWALLSGSSRRHLLAIHRCVQRFLTVHHRPLFTATA